MATLADTATHAALKSRKDLCRWYADQGQFFKNAVVKSRWTADRGDGFTWSKSQACKEFVDQAYFADNAAIKAGQLLGKINRKAKFYLLFQRQLNQLVAKEQHLRLP